jgi:hypothetical protein
LIREELRPSRTYPLGDDRPVWHLRLAIQDHVLKAVIAMEPFLIKKQDQAQASIKYLMNLITGEELIEFFNKAIERGTRSGYVRHIKMPFTHNQGIIRGKEFLKLGSRSPRRGHGNSRPQDNSFPGKFSPQMAKSR